MAYYHPAGYYVDDDGQRVPPLFAPPPTTAPAPGTGSVDFGGINYAGQAPAPAPAPNPLAQAVNNYTSAPAPATGLSGQTPSPAPSPTPTGPSDTEINDFWQANKGNAQTIVNAANQYGLTQDQILRATNGSVSDWDAYLKSNNISQGADGKYSIGTPFAGAWKDFNAGTAFDPAQMIPLEGSNGGLFQQGDYVYHPVWGKEGSWQGTPQDGQWMPSGSPEYYVTKKQPGKDSATDYEGAPYDVYKDGQYVRSDNYKDMGVDNLSKLAGLIVALGGGAVTAQAVMASLAAGTPAATVATQAGVNPTALASAAEAAGVTVGGPMSVGLPAGTALPAAGAATAATTSGLAGIKAAITSALAPLGITGADAVKIAGLVAAATGGGGSDMPTLGGGGGAGGATTGSSQGAEARAFLDQVLPALRPNANNSYGSSQWTKDANGNWTISTQLNPANQGIYNDATGGLAQLIAGIDPNKKAPTLLDSAGGNYSQALAQTIYDRTMGMQGLNIEAERKKMQARLAEQGFVPGNEGYKNEMARWENSLGEMSNKAAMDAQIQAASQALNEATFTNNSRTQGFKNDQELQQQLATILAGARTNTTAGLKDLLSQTSAPTGSPGSVQQAAQDKYTADLAAYQSDQAQRNDLIRAIMGLFA